MKPEDRITAYLFANKSKFEYSSLDAVVSSVKWSLFYGMSPLKDEEIRKVVAQWAAVNAVGLLLKEPPGGGSANPPAPGAPPTSNQSDLINAVKKAISTINDGVTIGKKGANVNIGVTGVTGNLKGSDGSLALGVSWTGKLKLEAESGPLHFEGTLTQDKWEITVSYPQDTFVPDLTSLGKVFGEGEKAIGKMAQATRSFKSVNDASRVAALIKPQAAAVQDAVEAATGIANAKSGASFGFKFGSPDPMPGQQGMPGGVQGTFVFTYTF